MTKEEFARILLSFTFLEDKLLVVVVYSPTASGLTAMEGQIVCTLDISTAYSNAKQDKDDSESCDSHSASVWKEFGGLYQGWSIYDLSGESNQMISHPLFLEWGYS